MPTSSQSSPDSWPSQLENFGSRKRSYLKEPDGGRWRKASDIHPRPSHASAHINYTDPHKQNQQGLQKTKQGTQGQREGTDGPLDSGGLGGGGPPGGSKAELLRASATQLRTRVQCWTWEERGMSRQE